jgi:Spy/CpxP family protein refolding chaperone
MRYTFTKFVFAAAITLLPALSFAQPPGGGRGGNPEEMMARQLTAMKEAVGLTEDQEKAIKPILAGQMKKQREMMEAGPSDDMREKMMAMRTETNDKIKKVLKEDQIEKFEKFQAEQRGRRGGGRGPGGPPPPPQN